MPSHPRHVALIAGPAHMALGLASTAGGVIGAIEVRRGLKAEGLVGTPGMPAPVAGRSVRTGLHARAFAAGMRRHALAATGGQTYAQMGRYLDHRGEPTDDETAAATDPAGQPVENPARQVWVTETALSTALNIAFFAESVAAFAILTGTAEVLAGLAFTELAADPRRRRGR
jgi:hypothetical protein